MESLKFYIADSTQRKNGRSPVFIYDTIPELIKHLEGACHRYFGKPRHYVMTSAADTGLMEDDRQGRAFYELMTEYFDIGYVKNKNLVRKHIFEAQYLSERRDEMGD
jgi:hypothetical protein